MIPYKIKNPHAQCMRIKSCCLLSLRWHYPDQVIRVTSLPRRLSGRLSDLPFFYYLKSLNNKATLLSRQGIKNIHPPTQDTTGLPMEECENGISIAASADVRHFLERRMNPAKLPNESFRAKRDHIQKGTTNFSREAPF